MLPAQHGVRRAGGLGFGHPDHPERVHRPEEPRDQGHEQRDLERERTRLGVDADDLVLRLRRLVGQDRLELSVRHQLRVLLQGRRDLFLLGLLLSAAVGLYVLYALFRAEEM